MLITPPPSWAISEQPCCVSETQSLPQLASTTPVGASEALATAAADVARAATRRHPQQSVSELLTAPLAQHTGKALEGYLNRWGRVQVRLGMNPRRFSLDTSEITALFPLWRQQALPEQQLLFTQFGLHHQRHHNTTVNLGIGHRHIFSEAWLLGYNLFYDLLLPQHHQRLGLGAEARRDYLSLSVNGYYPTSQWKNQQESEPCLARPARGVDMIVEAYLPQHPQLGIKVNAEHYFDDQVGAFTPNAKQRVSSVTLGLHYTPVPLFKLSYDYTLGQRAADRCRQQIALAVDYQLGVPLAQQLDSHRVASQRSLIGSLLEPVQRNNQILLAYKEKADKAGTAGQLQLSPEDELYNIGAVIHIPLTAQGNLTPYTLAFAGSLAAVTQANSNNTSLTVTPNVVGRQTLRVTATDQQGKVVHSNEMTIYILDAKERLPVIRTAYKNILTPGFWNGKEDDLVKALLPQIRIWPHSTNLKIISDGNEHLFSTQDVIQFGKPIHADNTIDILQLSGHYQLLSNGQPIECGGGGDCFYYSAAAGLKNRDIHTTVLELRRMSAQALLAHYNDEGVIATLTPE
ncbi:inverse autotransporter beta domain-containing protein [unidentified bacterial endosymbiont]|uniref:inverse autotransporter beta domain-containing protein n=1 Tax=unidentified bacterial endosymbiont TaxID=2355 RepID=UPI00209FD6E1|nr:inverse autotransporter beta domain-containing protein [unidentified bacterial endosymbiont]